MVVQSIGVLPSILDQDCIRWPARSCAVFPEFLVSNFQCLQLQEYIRLLLEYDFHGCQASWYFLLGKSHLILGENRKALECFLTAAKGVGRLGRE